MEARRPRFASSRLLLPTLLLGVSCATGLQKGAPAGPLAPAEPVRHGSGGGEAAAPAAPVPPPAEAAAERAPGAAPDHAPAKRASRGGDIKAGPAAGGEARPYPRPTSAGVKAGHADDNLQYNAFLGFLEANGRRALPCDVSQRTIVSVKDQGGLPLADAEVIVSDGKDLLARRRTYADGRTLIFPSQDRRLAGQSAVLRVTYRGRTATAPLAASRRHQVDVRLDLRRETFQRIPLDIAFVLDTTGSMGDEIDRLKKTLEYIHFQVTNLTPAPDVRFGVVLYRDKGDEYRTRVVPFTSDVKQFRAELGKVSAGGGGDTPEDVQEGLRRAIVDLKWRRDGAKLAFLIGDAPPHLDYGETYTYVTAMQEAAERGIKITGIGASGLDLTGEVVWRQLAQYTMSPYVFLTRGEKGDSDGSASSVSHHVGSNWVAENLDAVIIRMVKTELASYSPKGTPPQEDYFTADHSEGVDSDLVMKDLFTQAVRQLVDYSVQRIAPRTPVVVLPVKPSSPKLAAMAKKLEGRLAVSLGQSQEFQLVESRDLSSVIKTQSAQLSDKYDSDRAVKLGKLLPAKLAVISRVDSGAAAGQVELLVKLVRLETGEILSLSLLKIDKNLL